jgi:peptidoglycan/LPS O-acetylase OafA/YrhL
MGTFSYPIYLFHAAVGAWLVPQATWVHVVCYFVFSVAIGAWISKLIEIPMLKLREKVLAAE